MRAEPRTTVVKMEVEGVQVKVELEAPSYPELDDFNETLVRRIALILIGTQFACRAHALNAVTGALARIYQLVAEHGERVVEEVEEGVKEVKVREYRGQKYIAYADLLHVLGVLLPAFDKWMKGKVGVSDGYGSLGPSVDQVEQFLKEGGKRDEGAQ